MKIVCYVLILLCLSYINLYTQFEGGYYDGSHSAKYTIFGTDTSITRNYSSYYGNGSAKEYHIISNSDTTIYRIYSTFFGDGSSKTIYIISNSDTTIYGNYSTFFGDGSSMAIFTLPFSDTSVGLKTSSYRGDGHFKIVFDSLFNYKLLIPNNLRATLIDKQKIILAWDEVDNAMYYKLFRAIAPEGPYTLAYFGNNLQFIDEGNHLNPATYYYYRVIAENNEGSSGLSDILEIQTLPEKHMIFLTSGWNIISTYIKLANKNIEEVILPIVDDVVIIKNNIGQIYYPEFEINDIGNWNYHEAYQVYTKKSTILEVEGAKSIPQNEGINLAAGWNMLAYLRDNPMDIEIALLELTSNNILIIAKDNMGNVFYPAFEINMIGDMLPGQGYQIYLIGAAVFKYPQN